MAPPRSALRDAGDRAVANTLFGLTRLLGAMPIDRALRTAHRLGTALGPRTGRHRIVLRNLERAFPDLPRTERERIGAQMWGHQARLIVEAAFPRRLFDYDPLAPAGRVEVTNALDLSARREAGTPTLFFTAHTGCFELLPGVGRRLDYPMATLFRAPNNRHLAERLMAERRDLNGLLVRAGRGAAATLASELKAGRSVGVLVDQKFRTGPMVPFFGHDAPTNPLVARLARLTGGEVVPVRCIRLPDQRYRIDIEAPLALPLMESGEVDVPTALAMINAKVETWVHEHPEQWMWFHRRWG